MWPDPDTYRIATWLFLRGLGAVAVIAFVSLMVQLPGLFGSRGISSVGEHMAALRSRHDRPDLAATPTLFWLRSDDRFLWLVAGAGLAGALLLLTDVTLLPALVATWVCYLSFVVVGQEFLSYQWDVLLLDVLVVAVPLAVASPPSPLAVIAAWLLALRFVLCSGTAKLRSGDPTWRDGTALTYHFETQPLPTRLALYAHHLPPAVLRAGTFAALAVEIGLPVVAVVPGPTRIVAVAGMAALQVAILLTGNYGFFNLLALVLLVPLVPDGVWQSLAGDTLPTPAGTAGSATAAAVLAAPLLAAHALRLYTTVYRPRWARTLLRRLVPLRLANGYGLFAVMTTARPEIVIEGYDGEVWRPYRFRWKPGQPARAPRWNAPHQPRLDWQLWFAALSGRPPAWVQRFAARLLEGSPPVLRLLDGDPFDGAPPQAVRAWLYDYRFASVGQRRATGRWWQRDRVGTYLAPVTLES